MDIKRLEYFCAIIEKGQIGKAAQSLHISQPPLSMRLRELEEELGVTLIHRRGKAWQITPEGQLLYQKAQFILSYMEGVKNDVSSVSGYGSWTTSLWNGTSRKVTLTSLCFSCP